MKPEDERSYLGKVSEEVNIVEIKNRYIIVQYIRNLSKWAAITVRLGLFFICAE